MPKLLPVVKSEMFSPLQVAKWGSNSEFVSWKWNGRAACEVEANVNADAAIKTRVTSKRGLIGTSIIESPGPITVPPAGIFCN